MGDTAMRIYEFGPFRVDARRRLLLREDNQVRLPTKAFETLLVLLEEKGRLVEKDELMRRVWPDAVVEENNLTVNMSALRKSLGESPREHRYLVTVPGRGYQFVADVRQHVGENGGAGDRGVQADSTPGVVDTHPRSSAEYLGRETRRNKRGVLILLSALLVTTFVVSYLGYERYLARNSKAGITSIAVLPFANNTGDPNAEYLSDGISESLINRLSQLPGVKVIARSSAFKYKGTEVDLKDVARALGVEAILTGRVTQRGENLSISVELVNAIDKTQMWGEQYDRKATDLLAVQSEISREIANKLRLRLSAGEERHLAEGETVNPQAYELLLKGRFIRLKGGAGNLKKAVEYFQQAAAVDPQYALAYAELSFSYSVLIGDSVLDPKELVFKAEAAAHKALELDESLAQAHLALAIIKINAWDWANAESECQRALELNPNLAHAHIMYSGYLSNMGRHEQAIMEGKRGKELDPLSPRVNVNYGFAFLLARRYEQAIEIFKKTLELNQNFGATHGALGFAYLGKGMYAEAIAEFQEEIRLNGDDPVAQIYLGSAYAKMGKQEKAQAILQQLEKTKEYVAPGELAVLYTSLGERDKAFASLEKAYATHDLQLQYLKVEPGFDPLREDQRFQDLMRRVGLPL